jgi:TPR repeat protein
MRMGERYLKGDGVKKNLIQARTYLQEAAAQGSPTAKEDLDQLDQ